MSEEKTEQKADGYNELVDMVTEVSSKEAATHSEPKGAMRDAYGRFTSNAEKQDEEALDKLLGSVQVLDDVQTEEKPEAEAKGTKEGKETSKEAESKVSQRALDKARKALELDGWSEEDFEELSEQRIVALGKKASERQAKISQELEAKSKQRTEDGEAGEDETSAARVASRAEPEGQADEDLESTLKPIKELFGEETGAAIAAYVQKALGLSTQQVKQLEQRLNAVTEEKAEKAADSARDQLVERFPELKDEEVYDEVVEEMTQLVQLQGRFKSMESLMEAACRMKGLGETKAEKKTKSPAVQSAKANGTTSARTNGTPAKALSIGDREDLALDAIFKGKGRTAARNAWEGM